MTACDCIPTRSSARVWCTQMWKPTQVCIYCRLESANELFRQWTDHEPLWATRSFSHQNREQFQATAWNCSGQFTDETTRCNWLASIRTIIYKSQPNSFITLTFRSHRETFIRRSWYSVLPDLDVTIKCHIKKAVVFLMWHLICTSRSGRTEYQLLLMKVSRWDWNVKVIKEFGCDL